MRTGRRHKATKGSLSLLKRQQIKARRQRLALKKQLRRALAQQSLLERKMELLHHVLDVILMVITDCHLKWPISHMRYKVVVRLSVRPSVCLSVCACVFAHKMACADIICCWNLAVVLVSCMHVSFLSPAQCMVHTSLDNSAMHKYHAALWSSNLTVLCTGDRWDAACVLETQLKLLSY